MENTDKVQEEPTTSPELQTESKTETTPKDVPVYPEASHGVLATPVAASDSGVAPNAGQSSGMLKRLMQRTRAYLAEYAVLLIVLSSLIFLMMSLFSGIIDYFGADKQAWYFTGSWAYKTAIAELSAAVALIPILILLTERTGGTEDAWPVSKQSNWRKGFLGIFLIVMGLTAVGYTIGFIYVLASIISNAGLAVDANTKVWQALVKDGFAILLFGLSALLYARDYRETNEGNVKLWHRIHRYGLVAVALLLVVLFVAMPLKKQRDAYVDDLVTGDLRTIITKVSTYSYSKYHLPKDLDALDLPKEVKTRAANLKYEYKPDSSGGTYQVCATFKTDASNKNSDNPIEALSSLSSLSSGATTTSTSSNESPDTHKKGNQCFKQVAAGARSYYSSPSSSKSSTTNLFNSQTDPSYDDYNLNDYNSL